MLSISDQEYELLTLKIPQIFQFVFLNHKFDAKMKYGFIKIPIIAKYGQMCQCAFYLWYFSDVSGQLKVRKNGSLLTYIKLFKAKL